MITLDMTNPYENGLAITNMTGIAELKASVNSSEIATNDGALYNSARTNTRNIVMTITPLWTRKKLSNGEIVIQTEEDGRHIIQKMFPIKKLVKLQFITDVRNEIIEGYVDSSSANVFDSKYESVQISIVCMNPYFEDFYPQPINFSGVEPRFEFPFGFVPLGHTPHLDHTECALTDNTAGNIVVSELLTDTIRNIQYEGDAATGMEMTIYALREAANFTIYNMRSGEKFQIKYALQPNDRIIISTIRNKKSAYHVRDGVYTNILNYVDKSSVWLELQKGENIIAYEAESGVEYLQFSVVVRILYEGV
jgi:hypothetical protein